jgi:Second Messenger Oligonucleotide or Dinucleotide Synthetase domain
MIMTPNEYLTQILKSQELKSDGDELEALQSARADVEDALRAGFSDCKPSIRYGGSKAKGTMILDDYDLDVICYFPLDDTSAGETLADIYNNVRSCLVEKDYVVQSRTTALRLRDKDGNDFHIDVVPGRFTDATKADAYLHQNGGSKKFLKTNIQTHIDYVRGSGCTDMIRLMKLWRRRSGVSIRTFPMELLVIEVLKGTRAQGLDGRFTALLTELRDNIDDYSIEDPANPTGNDLSELLNDTVRASFSAGARSTLQTVEASGWEAVFGAVEAATRVHKVAALAAAAVQAPAPTRPWSNAA